MRFPPALTLRLWGKSAGGIGCVRRSGERGGGLAGAGASGNGGTIIKAVTRRGLADFGSVEPVMPGRVNYDPEYTKSLAYGIDENWGAFEGTSRRGIVAFKLTDQYKDSDEWELISDFIPSLKLKLPKEEFTNKALLTQNYDFTSMIR